MSDSWRIMIDVSPGFILPGSTIPVTARLCPSYLVRSMPSRMMDLLPATRVYLSPDLVIVPFGVMQRIDS